MKLIYIRAAKSRGYLTLGLCDGGENKKAFTVSEACYAEIGSPLVGEIIDSGELEVIKECDESYRATLYALRILSYGDNTRKKLYTKLLVHGIAKEIAKEVVEDMIVRGYIDEARQLRRLIEREANILLRGPQKIKAKLLAEGFSSNEIDEQMDILVASGEIDFSHSAQLLLEKKLTRGATDEEKKKLLYKNGYSIC